MTRDFITLFLHRWANLPHFARLLLWAVFLGGAGLLVFKPTHRWFRQWRVERNLEGAREAVTKTRMQEARDLSLSVLQTGDPRIDAVRILEASMAALQDPRHEQIARALITHPEGTDEDRLTGFRSVVENAPLGLVGQSWVALPENCRKDPRFAQVFAERLIDSKRFGEAASVLLSVPPDLRDPAVNRSLIRVLIGSGKKDGFDEAQRLIATGFPETGCEQEPWFDLLESIPPLCLQGGLLQPIRSRLESSTVGSPARRSLMLSRLEYATRFSERSAILTQIQASWANKEPVETAKFLQTLGLHQTLLTTYPNEALATQPAIFSLLLKSSIQAFDWQRLKELIDQHQGRLSRLEELAYRAVITAKTGKPGDLADSWAAAMNEASASTAGNPYLTLRSIAENCGMPSEANQAMLAAIRKGSGPLPLYSDLKPLLITLAQEGNEHALLEISAIYLIYEPGNPVLITQYAYLACLNDLADPDTILKALAPLAKELPKEIPLLCAVAAAQLCANEPDKALETLAPFDLKLDQLPPSFRIVPLAGQVLTGALAATDPLVREFPWKSLLPSERRKFGDMIRKADSSAN